MEQYLIRLSQEHETLPQHEVEAVLSGENISHTADTRHGPLLVVTADAFPERIIDRLAFAFSVSTVLERCETGVLLENSFADREWRVNGSFAVRAEDMSGRKTVDTEQIEQLIGATIQKTTGADVDLERPDTVFPVYITGDVTYICRELGQVNRSMYEKRTNEERPFAKPVSLHPRLARAVVNLAEIQQGDAVLDPFCGTGGLLLEAGLMGCDVYGSDVNPAMVDGTRKNLAAYNTNGEIKQCAVKDLDTCFPDQTFDAVVTDLPYGTASEKHGEELFDRFQNEAKKICNGTVVWISNQAEISNEEKTFTPIAEWYVHSKLTRYIYRSPATQL